MNPEVIERVRDSVSDIRPVTIPEYLRRNRAWISLTINFGVMALAATALLFDESKVYNVVIALLVFNCATTTLALAAAALVAFHSRVYLEDTIKTGQWDQWEQVCKLFRNLNKLMPMALSGTVDAAFALFLAYNGMWWSFALVACQGFLHSLLKGLAQGFAARTLYSLASIVAKESRKSELQSALNAVFGKSSSETVGRVNGHSRD